MSAIEGLFGNNKKRDHHAHHYLSGLMHTGKRKNIERMEERIEGVDYQGVQGFISQSAWDTEPVWAHVSARANELLGGRDAALYIDGSDFAKKGTKSVGVARQYCGRLGKVENCQAGVFAALGRGDRATLVDTQLYLPLQWTDDPERCRSAGVPEERIANHLTKNDLALQIIERARQRGLDFQWIGLDAGFGADSALRAKIHALGFTYTADIRSNQILTTLDGQKHTAKKLAQHAHQHKLTRCLTLRESADGPVRRHVYTTRVLDPNGTELHYIYQTYTESDGKKITKHTLSNAPATTPAQKLATMQAQRYFIERTFQDAKSEVGMADYQTQGWLAWHHHMALVGLAMLFFLQERLAYTDYYPLLTVRDITELLAHFLPIKKYTPADTIAAIKKRHKNHQKSSQSKRKRRKLTKSTK